MEPFSHCDALSAASVRQTAPSSNFLLAYLSAVGNFAVAAVCFNMLLHEARRLLFWVPELAFTSGNCRLGQGVRCSLAVDVTIT